MRDAREIHFVGRAQGRVLFLLWLAAWLLPGQTAPKRNAMVQRSEEYIGGASLQGRVPRWNGSLAVGREFNGSKSPLIWTIDETGRREEVAFELPGASFIAVPDVAAAPDGALVLVGHVRNNSPQFAPFLAWISPDRKRQVVTQLWPYFAHVVTVGPDGSIWMVGVVKQANSMYNERVNVLRHYDSSGRLLAEANVAGLRPFNKTVIDVSDAGRLMASSDRIGFMTSACEYVEFSFAATETGRYSCPSGSTDSLHIGGVALSSTDDIVLGGAFHAPFSPVKLNRSTGAWDALDVVPGVLGKFGIIGFHGQTLIAYPETQTLRFLEWTDATTQVQ